MENISVDSKKYNIGAVVLNYRDFNSTIACVLSLIDCDPPLKYIVVVDNDSQDGSYETLKETFAFSEKISVVNSGANKGYSFGNNIGIKILTKKNIDHFIIATSDTKVLSKNLVDSILNVIKKDVGVVGPRIICKGKDQNPSIRRLSFRYIASLFWKQRFMKHQKIFAFLSRALKSFLFIRAKLRFGERQYFDSIDQEQVYMLHGSFQVLTKSYISKCGLLDEDIFLFGEEDLISWNCEKNNLKRILLKNIAVSHEGDSSTEKVHGSSASIFILKNQIKSGLILKKKIDLMKLIIFWYKNKMAV